MAKSLSDARSSRPSLQTSAPNANQLLAALPDLDRVRLVRAMDVAPLILKTVLHKPGDVVRHVYFPCGGFFSVVTVLEDGRMVEVATVGREGVLGLPVILGTRRALGLVMVQAETDCCYRMSVAAFRAEMDRRGSFADLMGRYAHAKIGVIMQSTACNAVHSIEQRLARWLLAAHDRIGTDQFMLTQEFVAMMLGAARPTVSIVAGTLQRAGLIKYRHGRVTVVDRAALEAASCECYGVAAGLFRRVTA